MTVYPKKKKIGRRTYWYAICKGGVGTKTREKLLSGITEEAEARAHCILLKAQIEEGLNPFGAVINLDKWVEGYIHHIGARKAPGTVIGERDIARHFVRWIKKSHSRVKRPNEIRKAHMAEYHAQRIQEASERTVNLYRSYLSNLFDWSLEMGYVSENLPRQLDVLDEPQPGTVIFEREVLPKVLAKLSPVYQCALLVQYNGRMRPSEMCRLGWDDFDLGRQLIEIRNKRNAQAKKGRRRTERTKTGRIRQVVIDEEVLSRLANLSAQWATLEFLTGKTRPPFIFPNKKGGRLTFRVWNEILADACMKAGVGQITGYVVRHSAATHSADEGTPIEVLQEILGHTEIAMTRRYVHVSKERQRKASDCLRIGDLLADAEGEFKKTAP